MRQTKFYDLMKRFIFLSILWALALTPSWSQEMGLKVNKEFGNLGGYVGDAEFSPFRNYFAYSLGNNTLRIYDRNWEVIFEHQGNPEAGSGNFAFSPDEKYLAYGRYRGKNDIAIIRLDDMKVVQVLNQHSFFINYLQFSHDGKWLSSCSHDGQMILWRNSDDLYVFHSIALTHLSGNRLGIQYRVYQIRIVIIYIGGKQEGISGPPC